MRFILPVFSFLWLYMPANACLHASQSKIFPIGTKKKNIYVIEYKLIRTENYKIKDRFKIDYPDTLKEGFSPFWLIYGSLSVYDFRQKLIEKKNLDTSYCAGVSYQDSLQKSYSRIYKYVLENCPGLDYFKPEYISFCDYQLTCEKASVKFDTADLKDYIIYKNKKYEVPAFSDSTLKNPETNPYHQEQIDRMRINSVRIYKNKSIELVMLFMATGDWIYYYTTDKKLAGISDEDGMEYILSEEHTPDFVFKDIENGTYFEPVSHHGYGLDLFIVKEK